MITLEDAKRIAIKYIHKIDSIEEEKEAYVFIHKQKWDGVIVILKDTGKVLTYPQYILKGAK